MTPLIWLGRKTSTQTNSDIFLVFPRKQDLTFYANGLHWRPFAWNVKTCFLGKIRKKILWYVVCWKFYPDCLMLTLVLLNPDISCLCTISMCTVFRWVKAFKAGKCSVEDDTRPGRPKTYVIKANIAAVKIVVKQDAWLSVKDIASCTGISEGSVQTILKKCLDWRKVCSRWVPHLLTEEQKTQRLKCVGDFWKHTKAVGGFGGSVGWAVWPGGRGFNSCRGRQHSFVET